MSEKTVVCLDLFEQEVVVPVEDLIQRVSVYGLFFDEDGQLLVIKTRSTGKYFLVGGEIELGETPEQALIREAKEEAGVEVVVGKLFTADQVFFYYNTKAEAYQNLYLIYLGAVVNFQGLSDEFNVADDESFGPEFLKVTDLKRENCQIAMHRIMRLYIDRYLASGAGLFQQLLG